METITAPITEIQADWKAPVTPAVREPVDTYTVLDIRDDLDYIEPALPPIAPPKLDFAPSREVNTGMVFQLAVNQPETLGTFEVASADIASLLTNHTGIVDAKTQITVGDAVEMWKVTMPTGTEDKTTSGVLFMTEKQIGKKRQTINRFVEGFPIYQAVDTKHLTPLDMQSQHSWLLDAPTQPTQ
jgi:hypothetical protein